MYIVSLSLSRPASWVKVLVIGMGPSASIVQSTSIFATARRSDTWMTKADPEVQSIVMWTVAVTFTHRVSVVLAPSSSFTWRTASKFPGRSYTWILAPTSPDQSHSPSPSKSHWNVTMEPSSSRPVPEKTTSSPTSTSMSTPASATGFLFSASSPKQPAREAVRRSMAIRPTWTRFMDWRKEPGHLYNPSGIVPQEPAHSQFGTLTMSLSR